MLKGVLEGVRGILEEGIKAVESKPPSDNPVAIPYMKSAKSMLDGVIKEFKEQEVPSSELQPEIPPDVLPPKEPGLDAGAQAAKDHLT